MIGYALANTKRSWYVSNLNIYGTIGWGEFEYILAENVNSIISVLFNSVSIGDNSQQVSFADLVDQKGNNLPSSLKNPKIFIKQKSEHNAFVVGEEFATGFKIVRTEQASTPVPIDIYIVEMGE